MQLNGDIYNAVDVAYRMGEKFVTQMEAAARQLPKNLSKLIVLKNLTSNQFYFSFLRTTPPFITKETFSRTEMSLSGLPSVAMMSA